MGTLIVNFKNYSRILGEGSLRLADSARKTSRATGQEVIVAPPTPMLGLVASKVEVTVFAQSVSASLGEKSTGSIAPESVKAAGARGTILNHSEARLPLRQLKALVPRLAALSLEVCLCAGTASEAGVLSGLKTAYVAVEPPELIGSGVAVSRARPELISKSVGAARRAGYKGKILCGAGIVSGEDVKAAIKLGVDGVLVSSSVVGAKDWDSKLLELARSLN
jgi:triosephosphate isomerase (TIM)